MGKWIHRLSKIDAKEKTALCEKCGPVRITKKSTYWRCAKNNYLIQQKYKRSYRKYVKKYCERCNFLPKKICQLDVHHIDGNHKNNSPKNLMTLCANCHRIE